ncbi:pilin [Pseudomonas sp. QE6]|uniref:pilin n=1 Tax=Pseudomonas sp. QE6 TaxID=3242491 RepID=UPI003527F065
MSAIRTVQKGFTLIELMIVVAIIGILAAIAIPAYQDYLARSRVSEGLALAAAAKTGVTEYYASNGSWPTSNDMAGIDEAENIKGNSVTSVEVGAGGIVTITYNAKLGAAGSGKTVVLTPTNNGGSISWTCTDGDMPGKLRPAECRS